MDKVPAFTSHCRNCESPLFGQFCAQCGQRHRHPRLQVRDWLADAWEALTVFDAPNSATSVIGARIPATLIALVRHPGRLASDYVAGRRVRYLNPFQFALTTCALWWLAVSTNPQSSTIGLLQYMQFINLLSLPFLALFQYWPLRAAGYNYAEHLVLMFYVTGFVFLWRMFLALTYLLDMPQLSTPIAYADSFAFIAYFAWGLWGFTRGKAKLLALRITGAVIGIVVAGGLVNVAIALLNRPG